LLELAALCTSCEIVALKHEGELRGEAPGDAGVDNLLAALLDASQYETGWGAGRAFPAYLLQSSRNVVFAMKCDFYIGGLGDRRYVPLQEAFLALPIAISGWRECAALVVPREVFIVPRAASRRWTMASG